jgi:hypothetical protein
VNELLELGVDLIANGSMNLGGYDAILELRI